MIAKKEGTIADISTKKPQREAKRVCPNRPVCLVAHNSLSTKRQAATNQQVATNHLARGTCRYVSRSRLLRPQNVSYLVKPLAEKRYYQLLTGRQKVSNSRCDL